MPAAPVGFLSGRPTRLTYIFPQMHASPSLKYAEDRPRQRFFFYRSLLTVQSSPCEYRRRGRASGFKGREFNKKKEKKIEQRTPRAFAVAVMSSRVYRETGRDADLARCEFRETALNRE